MPEISAKRLAELEETQAKMDALEAGGVDNWENYGDALKDFWAERNRREIIETAIGEIIQALCEGVEEPAGRGCGYGVSDEATANAERLLRIGIENLIKEK